MTSLISIVGLIAFIGLPFELAQATENEVKISKRDCQRLVRDRSAADVEYKPGVDIHGHKVAPANVGGTTPKLKLPNELTIDIGVDLEKHLGVGDDSEKFSGNVSIGKVKFDHRTGRVTFNGQSIDNSHTNAFALQCRELLTRGR